MVAQPLKKAGGKTSRIQLEKRALISQAALDTFSTDGFRGATLDRIAERAGMSKTNLLYYFSSKDEIYASVIEQTVEGWLQPFADIDPDGDPIEELRRYITIKLKMAREAPEASRLFANEIQRGAPLVKPFLETRLKTLVDEKAGVIRKWIDSGTIAPVDPYHLIFVIWATTQHYADFETQIDVLLKGQTKGKGSDEQIAHAVISILLNGLKPREMK